MSFDGTTALTVNVTNLQTTTSTGNLSYTVDLTTLDQATLGWSGQNGGAGENHDVLNFSGTFVPEPSTGALLALGADTSIPEKDGYTILHAAGFQGRAGILPELAAHQHPETFDPWHAHEDGVLEYIALKFARNARERLEPVASQTHYTLQ